MDFDKLKKCFVSSLYKGDKFKNHDKPSIFPKMDEFDYFLFTNLDKRSLNTSWEIINYDSDCSNSITRSRYPKFQSWKLIKDKLEKEYDIIIYLDAYLRPATKLDIWKEIVYETINSDSGFVQSPHPVTNCPYLECDRIIRFKKDTRERINKTIQLLKKTDIGKNSGLWENICFSYSPKNENAIKLLDEFWNFYKKEEYTYRDQPLFVIIQKMVGIKSVKSKYYLRKLLKETGKCGNHQYC
jgi:hypothetical protein